MRRIAAGIVIALCIAGVVPAAPPANPDRDGGPRAPETTPAAQAAIARACDWLVAHQHPSGGWGCGEPPTEPSTGLTGLACLAFLAQGDAPARGRYGKELRLGIRYLLSVADPASGRILGPFVAEMGEAYDHAMATLALAMVYGTCEHDQQAIRGALRKAGMHLKHTQQADGGWGDPCSTAAVWMACRALHSVGIQIDVSRDAVERYARAAAGIAHHGDGSRAGSHETSQVAGWLRMNFVIGRADAPEVRALADRLAATYFITDVPQRISEWDYAAVQMISEAFLIEEGDRWARWYPPCRDYFVRTQQPDGSWTIEYCTSCKTFATALATLVLAAPDRVLPTGEF